MRPISALLGFSLLLVVWQSLSGLSTVGYLFGNPVSIAEVLWRDTLNGLLPSHLWVTSMEALLGLLIGMGLGTPLGFLLWYSPRLASLSRPYLLALGALPIFSFAPLVIVWFGIGFGMKVAVAALGVGLLALAQSFEGAAQFSPERAQLFQLLGGTRRQMLLKAVIPSSIEWVLNSARLCVNTAILGVFIGEFISSSKGIGHYMNTHGALYDVPAVFAGGVYLILLSSAMHGAVALAARHKLVLLRLVAVPHTAQILDDSRRSKNKTYSR